MNVIIVKCTKKKYWYHKYIGHTFQIKSDMKEGKFEVVNNEQSNDALLIDPSDCTLKDD